MNNVLRHGRLTDRGAVTVAHELFHAVQWGAPFFSCQSPGVVGDWIAEGTAEALGWDLVRMVWSPDPDPAGDDLWGNRIYRMPLPVGT